MELRPVFVRLCPPFYSHSNKYEFIFIWSLNIARSGHESNRMLIGCVYPLYVTRMRMNLVQEMERNWNWIFFHRTSRFALNYSSLLLNFVFPFILAIRYEEIRVYFIFFCFVAIRERTVRRELIPAEGFSSCEMRQKVS